jgi:hypothetical protein
MARYLQSDSKYKPEKKAAVFRKEAAMQETQDDIMRNKRLPRVGQTVQSKKHGTLWRVIEKKEVW